MIRKIGNIARGYNEYGKSVKEGTRKGALELACMMAYNYQWDMQGIYTTLMYCEQYDTIMYLINKLNLLNDYKENPLIMINTDSSFLGNYLSSDFKYIINGNVYYKSREKGILLPTGTNIYDIDMQDKVLNQVFNIFDLAGNLAEWTNNIKGDEIVVRGGSYSTNGDDTYFSNYLTNESYYASYDIGFRIVMYIK